MSIRWSARVFVVVGSAACLFSSAAGAQTVPNTSSPSLAILPDNGCTDDSNAGTGLGGGTNPIAFTETTAGITDANVAVQVTTPWRSDLQMYLTYSGGGGALLANNHDTSGDNYFATFDSDAATLCSAAAHCGTGTNCVVAPGPTCQPDTTLTVFNTLVAPGTFTLAICDRVAADLATLVQWSVTLTGPGLPVELISFTVD